MRLRRNKYAALATVIDNIRFDSRKEARRYVELKLMQMAGEIHCLEYQVPYPLWVTNLGTGEVTQVGKYLADFRYAAHGKLVVEDVKGVRTPLYKLKRKIVEGLYGIVITEI